MRLSREGRLPPRAALLAGRGTYGRMRILHSLVVWVDPASIHQYVPKFPLVADREPKLSRRQIQAARSRHPFVVGADEFPEPQPVEAERNYALMADLLMNLDDVTASQHFRNLCRGLHSSGGPTTFRKQPVDSEEEAKQAVTAYATGLVESFKLNGYLPNLGSDPGLAAIGADGTLLKSGQGHHRFCVARTIGVAALPLRIHFVHEDWALENGWSPHRGGFRPFSRLAAGLDNVESAHAH